MRATHLITSVCVVGIAVGIALSCDDSSKDDRELNASKIHGDRVTSVAFSPDGRTLASGSDDATIRLLDVTDYHGGFTSSSTVLAIPKELEISPLLGLGSAVSALQFSPDGRWLATGGHRCGADGTLQLWDLEEGYYVFARSDLRGPTTSLDFDDDGARLLTGDGAPYSLGEATEWAIGEDGATAGGTYDQQLGGILAVSYSPDGERFATIGEERVIRVRRTTDGALLHELSSEGHLPLDAAFSPDGALLATVGDDGWRFNSGLGGILHVWDMTTGEQRQPLNVERAALRTVAYSPDGTAVAVAGDGGVIYLLDLRSLSILDTLEGHGGAINDVTFSSNGQLLASASDDRYLRIWYVGDLVGLTCNDGIDNDGDGWTDALDPDCRDGNREIGFGETECNDGRDNDGDGLIDADDPECASGGDDDESFGGGSDGGPDDGGVEDGGTEEDGGIEQDGGTEDGGQTEPDSGEEDPDAGEVDAGIDGGALDAGL